MEQITGRRKGAKALTFDALRRVVDRHPSFVREKRACGRP